MKLQAGCFVILLFTLYWTGITSASAAFTGEGQGPEQVVMQSTVDPEKVPKPAYLPHHEHQWLECDGCHHTKSRNGKKVDWTPGQPIEKCETCHNSKAGLQEQFATLKRAGHKLCMECHIKSNAALAQCGVCHRPK